MEKNGNVPQLRFPGFEGDWVEKTLGEVSNFYNGKAFKQEELLDQGTYPVLRVGNLFTNGNWYYSDLELDENKVIDDGDLIFAWSASFGPRIWKGGKVIYHYHIWKVVENPILLNKAFYYWVLENETLRMKSNSSNGFALLHITKGTIENWHSFFPTLPEQTKIADFLSAVDEKLQALQRKKARLTEYKKGMMQQLFSQTLRFKDDAGHDFPDWEEKRLGEVADFSKGKGISKSDIAPGGKQQCIRYGELYTIYTETISEVVSWTNLEPNGLVFSKANDVIIPSSGETAVDIATASCVLKSGIALGGDLNIIRSPLNGVFLSYYLNGRKKSEIASLAQGASVVHLYASNLENLQVEIPSLPEQTKIAAFLSALDEKIQATQQAIDRTSAWKKGLLQQLFV
jgi:type I restriction enzyme S subunit